LSCGCRCAGSIITTSGGQTAFQEDPEEKSHQTQTLPVQSVTL